jgi:hypothetical protein
MARFVPSGLVYWTPLGHEDFNCTSSYGAE